MTWPGSLWGRLALALGLGLTALWLATAWATASLLRDEMDEVFDSALAGPAQRILPLAVLDLLGRDEQGVGQRIARLHPHQEFFTYLVRDDQGRVVLRSHGAVDADFPPFDGIGFRQTPTHRLYFDAALRGTITIAVAEPLSHRAEVAREALAALAVPLIVVIPLSLIGLLVVLRLSLRPVLGFGRALARRGVRDLSKVGTDHLPSEMMPVAEAVNQLLDRLRHALQAERSFTANAAHELRTPLAAALAQAQRLRADSDDPKAVQRGAEIERSLKRLTRLSEKLLQLARAEGGRVRSNRSGDIRPVLDLVVAEFKGSAGGARITVASPEAPVLSDIDPDAFAIVARNLIENALLYGASDTAVEVTLTAEGLLRVRNGGAAVPAEVLHRLTARFEGQAQSEGSGLGLSIVQAIADGAGATLTLHSPAPAQVDGVEAAFQLHQVAGRV